MELAGSYDAVVWRRENGAAEVGIIVGSWHKARVMRWSTNTAMRTEAMAHAARLLY